MAGYEQIVKVNQGAQPPPNRPKGLLASRTKRERTMIYLLIIVALGAALIYFVALPGLTKINDLTDEVAALEEQEMQYRAAIAQTESYEQSYADSLAAYDRAREMYMRPMTPESLDEMITRLLLAADLEPETLSLKPLALEPVARYIPASLSAEGESSASSDERSSYVYNVNVSASGTLKGLRTLLDNVAGMNGIRLASYTYTEAKTGDAGAAGSSAKAPGKDTFSLVFKIYVFVEGAYEASAAEGADGTTEQQE
jgi:hypothetical protein